MNHDVTRRLVQAQHVLARHGHDELHFGHLSVIDRDRGTVWLKRGDSGFASVTESDLVGVDLQGRLVEGKGPVHSEVWIHIGLYRAREDVASVAHSHAVNLVAFSSAQPRWPVVDQYSLEMSHGMAWYESSRLIVTPELGAAVAATMGGGRTCFLRSHGAVIADSSLEAATVGTVELGRAVENIIRARALGEIREMPASDQVAMLERFVARRESRVRNMWGQLMCTEAED
jgi:L-fuculose-phosphate aldolase